MRIQGGGGGQGVRTPPGKSQVIWVSMGNKQLDPPGKSWTPPPPPWKMLDPQKSKQFCKYKGGKLIESVARKPYFVAREQERIRSLILALDSRSLDISVVQNFSISDLSGWLEHDWSQNKLRWHVDDDTESCLRTAIPA